MICNVCEGTGFINLNQVPEEIEEIDEILKWIRNNSDHDVKICRCCGDGETWYGERGEHYHSNDPEGPTGPYAYNGGLCECN